MASRSNSIVQPTTDYGAPAAASDLEVAIDSDHGLAVFVQQVLGQMHDKFQNVSETVMSKIDDFGKRIDELEQELNAINKQLEEENR